MPVFRNFQPRVLLDRAGLQCEVGGVEAENLFGPNGNQLGGVESPRHSPQGTRQRSPGRILFRQPKASSRAGAGHPLEVPAHLANHRVENRRRDLFHKRPVFANRLREGIQTIRQDAVRAQENGVRLQACALLGTMAARGRREPGTGPAGAMDVPDDECSATKSSVKLDGFALVASGSATEKPVASGWLSGWHRWICVRWRGDRWFFTSLFLMRLMAAPVVRLPT